MAGVQNLDDKQQEMANAMFETKNSSLWHLDPPSGSGSDPAEDDGRRASVVSWWNRNVVTAYSGCQLTYLSIMKHEILVPCK